MAAKTRAEFLAMLAAKKGDKGKGKPMMPAVKGKMKGKAAC